MAAAAWLEALDDPPNGNTDNRGAWRNRRTGAIDQFRGALGGASETFASVDVTSDDDALELTPELAARRRAQRRR